MNVGGETELTLVAGLVGQATATGAWMLGLLVLSVMAFLPLLELLPERAVHRATEDAR